MSNVRSRAGTQASHVASLDEDRRAQEGSMTERGEDSVNSSRTYHELTVPPQGSNTRATRWRKWQLWSSKRHVMLGLACVTTCVVFLVNLIFAIIMTRKNGLAAVVPLYEGSCSWWKRIDTGLHILINVLSTLLLGASNLCMQLLAAPTRKEVEIAHGKGVWLDIGVPSWRNLWRIEPQRSVIWWILALSSIPINFIYNSVVSTSIPSFGYGAAVVSENFLHQAPWGVLPSGGRYGWPTEQTWNKTAALEYMQEYALDPQNFDTLTKAECVQVYTNVYGNRTNLLVITEDSDRDQNSSVHAYEYIPAQWSTFTAYWLCEYDRSPSSPGSLNCQDYEANTQEMLDQWTMHDRPVKYCLSQRRTADYCRLNYSPYILIVICITSLLKAVCIVWAICNLKHQDSTLVTLGDAICSFLQEEDKSTAGMGIVTREQFKRPFRFKWLFRLKRLFRFKRSFRFKRPFLPVWTKNELKTWTEKKSRSYSLASRRRWFVTIALFLIITTAASVSAGYGIRGTMERGAYPTFEKVMNMDFGAPDPTSFTAYFLRHSGTIGFMSNVLWANCWQIIIAGLYLAENSLLTSMVIGREWANYAIKPKPLRVSHPKGKQRSSFYLNMPFRYGLPLMISNMVLHYFVSRSFFLVSTTTFYPNALEDKDNSFVTTGYSSNATLTAIIFGALNAIVFLVIATTRKMPSSMPLVLSCSAAISAACHPGKKEDCYQDPVSWGVVDEPDRSKGKPGRCSFTTSSDLRQPQDGEQFSGVLSS